MDSGLGSDDERRHRTKEQKQQQNQQRQLFSNCFIDASTLGDESDQDIPPNDERSRGSLIFQNSIKQYSMLQMDHPTALFSGSTSSASEIHPQDDPSTPFNSIVQVENEPVETYQKTSVGFFVDLNSIEEPSPSLPKKEDTEKHKNLFSLVIDYKEPTREMPSKLSESLYNRNKAKSKKTKKENETSSKSSAKESVSSRNSSVSSLPPNISLNIQEIYIEKNNSIESGSSKNNNVNLKDLFNPSCSYQQNTNRRNGNNSIDEDKISNTSLDNTGTSEESKSVDSHKKCTKNDDKTTESYTYSHNSLPNINDKSTSNNNQHEDNKDQFVKLSDLQKQCPRLELTFGPRMVHSIPQSSWVESPLSLSRSATYRSAPPRPPEPDPYELSDSGSYSDISISQTTGRSVQRLGTDLLRMFLEEIGPDITIEVGTYRLRAHKCILSSRCQYFAAVLGGNWLESSGNVIPLHGYSYDSVHFAMCHIYSGAAHVPESINLAELAALADMLGLEGLKEVAAHALKIRYCHSFHKPCSGCSAGVLEILPLAAAYSLDDLYHKCLRWITQNFVRIWPTKAFAALSKDLQDKCYKQHVVHMSVDSVLSTLLKCEELLGNIPAARWAEPVTRLVKQLSVSCQLYLSQHFCEILSSPSLLELNNQHNVNLTILEEKMIDAVRTLGPEHACQSYERCSKLLETQTWNMKMQALLQKVQINLEQHLSRQMSRVSQCHAWTKMNPALKVRIKEMSRLPRPIKMESPLLNSLRSSRASRSLKIEKSPERFNPEHAKLTSAINSSIRRSLLLAAKSPQMPTSLYVPKISSTLTKPTQSSAAKSFTVRSNNLKSTGANAKTNRPASEKNILKPTLNSNRSIISSKSDKNIPKSTTKTKSEVKLNKLEIKVHKPEGKVLKSELKVLKKPELKIFKPELKVIRPETKMIKQEAKYSKSETKGPKAEVKPLNRPIRASLYAPKNRPSTSDNKTKVPEIPGAAPKKKLAGIQQEERNYSHSASINDKRKTKIIGVASLIQKNEKKVTKTVGNITGNENTSSSEENTFTKTSLEEGDTHFIPKMIRSDTFLKDKPTVITQSEIDQS